MEQLSNKIRKYRFENDEMTQKVLAERVGVSRQTMNAIENCHHAPTVSVAIRIADVFQVPVDYLFTLVYEGKPTAVEQPSKATVDRLPEPIREPARAAPDRLPAPMKESVREDRGKKPVEGKEQRQTTLADLQGVMGS